MIVHNFKHTIKEGWIDVPNVESMDSEKTLVLAFFSPEYSQKPEVFLELSQMFKKSKIAGCSTAGEIKDNQLSDASIVVSVICFDNAKIRISSCPIDNPEESKNCGLQLSNDLKGDNLKGVFVLSDGLNANGSSLISGFNENIDSKDVCVGGGLAADGSDFNKTWILEGEVISSNKIIAVGLYGEGLVCKNSTGSGWDIFGPERTITKSSGNILYEIDEKPALHLYKEYLGERSAELPASALLFPLQIRPNKQSNHHLIRTILAVDEKDNSMTFAGDMPQGHYAQLMKANFERVIDGAHNAGTSISNKLFNAIVKGNPETCINDSLTIAISCVGRRLMLGLRAQDELDALSLSLGRKPSVIGFYSYGELASADINLPCELHNQSMTLMTIMEAA